MGDSIDANDLPPPRISQEKIDTLLRAIDPLVATSGSSPSTLPSVQKLKGREVLIPAYGGVAFYEGELCPDTRSKPGSKEEEEEIVYIATPTETKATKRSVGKDHNDEKDVATVGISEAIEWLRRHSSDAKNSETTTEARATKAPAKAAIKPSGKAAGPSKSPSSTPAKSYPPKSRSREPVQAPAGPMFNINEEYSADGKRIIGEAVNLSTRLKAVYGDENPVHATENDPKDVEEERPAPTKKISDDEYVKISNRLEELALMEEEEAKRIKEGRRKPAKPLGGGTPTPITKNKAKPTSSFGFQKGFLNKKKATRAAKCCDKDNPFKANKKGCGPSCSTKKDSKPSPTSGGVKIDVSQNKVHEIPREGRQQPVPSRKPQDQSLGAQGGTRLLDSSVFSGQVSERSPPLNSGVISKDVAARVAANEQTQSLQHELEQQQQQQQQRQTRPKRVSRFRQQRLQEQQQQR